MPPCIVSGQGRDWVLTLHGLHHSDRGTLSQICHRPYWPGLGSSYTGSLSPGPACDSSSEIPSLDSGNCSKLFLLAHY